MKKQIVASLFISLLSLTGCSNSYYNKEFNPSDYNMQRSLIEEQILKYPDFELIANGEPVSEEDYNIILSIYESYEIDYEDKKIILGYSELDYAQIKDANPWLFEREEVTNDN